MKYQNPYVAQSFLINIPFMTASRQTTLVLSLISTLSQCEPYGCNAQCICKCHSHTYSLKVGMTVHSFSAVLYLQDRCLLVHFFWGARARLLLPAAVSSSDMSGSEQRGVFIKPRVAWSEGKKKKKPYTQFSYASTGRYLISRRNSFILLEFLFWWGLRWQRVKEVSCLPTLL